MFSCCGIGRKKRKSIANDAQPNEQTPLLDPNILPFVAASPPKAFDDEALVEYQRRLDRIIEEAAEKIVSVTNGHIPQLHMEASGSGSTASNSPDDDGIASTRAGHRALPQVGSSAGNDTLWRAEKKTTDNSIYSLQKVRKSSGSSRHGKGPAVQMSENDEDQYGTVASYRTASAGGAEDEEEEEEASYSDDSGNQTPTGLSSKDGRSKSRKQNSRRAVQDIWQAEGSASKQKKPLELDKALTMSESEFARLIMYE